MYVLGTIEGEFIKEVKYYGITYSNYDYNGYPELKRMKNALRSDSLVREE